MVCAVLDLYKTSWCWHRCPEIWTSSVDWAQLSRFFPEDGDRIQVETLCLLI
jgi:hypothetical protein